MRSLQQSRAPTWAVPQPRLSAQCLVIDAGRLRPARVGRVPGETPSFGGRRRGAVPGHWTPARAVPLHLVSADHAIVGWGSCQGPPWAGRRPWRRSRRWLDGERSSLTAAPRTAPPLPAFPVPLVAVLKLRRSASRVSQAPTAPRPASPRQRTQRPAPAQGPDWVPPVSA